MPSLSTAVCSRKYKLWCPAVFPPLLLYKRPRLPGSFPQIMGEKAIFAGLPMPLPHSSPVLKVGIWMDQTMQLGKTGKGFLIKQKRASLFECDWCGTGLERKRCRVTISLTHWPVVHAMGCALLFDCEYWLKTLVLEPLKSLVKLSLIWARPRLDPLWLCKGQR